MVLVTVAKENNGPYPDEIKSDDLVDLYLGEVGSIPLLDAQEELELAVLCRRGEAAREWLAQGQDLDPEERTRLEREVDAGEEARTRLINANSRLVVSIAKNYLGLGVPFLDLVQEGNVGLMEAIRRFDPEMGYRLSTYATWWIRQAVARAVAAQGRTIRLPIHKLEDINRIKRASVAIQQRLDRDPTMEELAEELDMPEDKVEQLIRLSRDTVSLEKPVDEEGESTLVQFIEDESSPSPAEEAVKGLVKERIEEALTSLTPRQERVLRLRYGLEDGETYTLKEIGKKLGLTRERIRQIEGEALQRLRHPGRRRKLEGYYES